MTTVVVRQKFVVSGLEWAESDENDSEDHMEINQGNEKSTEKWENSFEKAGKRKVKKVNSKGMRGKEHYEFKVEGLWIQYLVKMPWAQWSRLNIKRIK